MDSRCASERNVSFFDDPHPERLSTADRRDVAPWQPFIGVDMSSTDLNNEDYIFKGRHFDQEIIVLCVRWYLTFKLELP